MKTSNEQNKYLQAQERVKELKKFYSNLFSYCIFILLLAGLNYYINELRHPWFLWAALGWGIGLVFLAIKTFGIFNILGKDWEEKKIKEFMEKDEYSSQKNIWE